MRNKKIYFKNKYFTFYHVIELIICVSNVMCQLLRFFIAKNFKAEFFLSTLIYRMSGSSWQCNYINAYLYFEIHFVMHINFRRTLLSMKQCQVSVVALTDIIWLIGISDVSRAIWTSKMENNTWQLRTLSSSELACFPCETFNSLVLVVFIRNWVLRCGLSHLRKF